MIVRLQVEVKHRDGRIPPSEEIEQAVVDLLEDMSLVDLGPSGDSVYEVVHALAVEPPRGQEQAARMRALRLYKRGADESFPARARRHGLPGNAEPRAPRPA